MINKTEHKLKENKANELRMENDKSKGDEVEDLKKQLEDANFLAEERLDHLKYLQADFDNYRKKFDKEKEYIIKLSNENLIQELIIILDDFDNSIKLMGNEKDKEGISRLYRKLFKMLEKHGLKHIDALGKKFDPNLHEVLAKEKSEKEEGTITEEIQKGYLLDSKVIRYTKVKISESKEVKEENQNLNNIDIPSNSVTLQRKAA